MAAEAETLTLDSPPPQSQPEKVSVSFSIWPPTQRTRDAVLSRLIETLSLRPLRALQALRPELQYMILRTNQGRSQNFIPGSAN
ncbi:hypothetical protein RJ640_000606 [Escallonia rubra]|uniref:WPP domain-containing protein n=1 Tax=Escallonia rubra TaxID=112253 RepID=A0AA88RGZ1_9ASTE|nr:hypothetical protein RJ640_000606 [Escallonia rubra]